VKRPARVALGLLAAAAAAGYVVAQGAGVRDAVTALRAGQYDAALAAYARDAQARPDDFVLHAAWVRALAEVGRYDEAEQAARAFLGRSPRSVELFVPLGEVLILRGKSAEADQAFQRALAGRARDALSAQAWLATLDWERGRREQAKQRLEQLVEAYNGGRARTASDLMAVGRACRLLGQDNPQAFKDALKAFDEAAAADPGSHEPKLLLGELFLEKYNSTEAQASFKQVLDLNPQQPRALLGMAQAKDFDGERGIPELLKKALSVNPRLVPARAAQSELLNALENYPAAAAEAEAALETNPESGEALSALAASRLLSGEREKLAAARARFEELYPSSGELLVTVAEACVRNRLYKEAAGYAREALQREPRSWRAMAVLGQNELRLGQIEEGKRSLERSFEGDPYNVWVKNTLDLLDTFPQYRTTETPSFRLFIEARESDLLAPYVGALAEEALQKLSERYQHKPQLPIRIEVYPSHADFSVRTVGLAGLGALGVCFGNVVAIDSPQARERGKFNWGSTLWHELAHAVTMGATDNKVPRWLTEGLSVYEERRARQGWGDDLSIEFLVAMKGDKLLPLRDLNNGFVRPTSPEQIGLSYYQASLVVEHLEATRGLQALLGLLKAYKDGKPTSEAFVSALGMSVDEVDKGFRAQLDEKLARPLAAIRPAPKTAPSREQLEARARADDGDFLAHALLGRILLSEKRPAEALPHLERARELWPESAGDESPYFGLAQIRKDKGDAQGAAEELKRLVARNESHEQANLELASLLEKLGDDQGAAAALERVVYIYPLDAKLFQRLAPLAARRADRPAAVRARRALLALAPVDKAEAYYQLALAELEAGDRAAARRHVLLALETAPRFAEAQQLLLKLHRQEKP
jgi:tetratricopeptide (TPR) repeat protein